MSDLIHILCPGNISPLQQVVHHHSLQNLKSHWITCVENLQPLENQKIVFSISLDETGISVKLWEFLHEIARGGPQYFKGCSAVIFVFGANELFTKSISQQLIYYLNQAGVSFIGRPLLEATGSMQNLKHMALSKNLDLYETCLIISQELMTRLMNDCPPKHKNPHLLVLHASNWDTSNTLTLWSHVKDHLGEINIKEIHIENGAIKDCIGCPYKTCSHYGQQDRCYYGGIVVSDIYPAILNCHGLLLLCPNYNDAISANMSAMINRLTALFRKTAFYDKYLFSIIVSGHSGSDIIAKQLISALSINKTFRLPHHFAIMKTANDPGDIEKNPDLTHLAQGFAQHIVTTLKHK